MKSYLAFLRKEILEIVRNGKLIIFGVIFFVFGITNPMIAKLTPWLYELLEEDFAQIGIAIPQVVPTAIDSWVQFFKNIPMALIVFVVLFSNMLTKEYSAGTLILVLTKGIERYKVLLSKFTVSSVFWATGAALFIRLKDYWEAGGLDGRFFAHMEEIDLCWRLRSRGRGIVCIPQSVVYHVGAATLKRENPRKTFLNFRNNLLMLYKNLPEKELKKVMFIRGLLDWVATFVFLLKGDGKNARAVWQARKEFKHICPDFASSRTENLAKATGQSIPEKVDYSILWKFHACGKKVFSRLK